MNNNNNFSALSRFLLWCAGVDMELIKTCSFGVILKYKALGGLVLTPALLAFPSASYFLLVTLLPKAVWSIYVAMSIGLIWSIIVLNFDRFLVITFNKSESAWRDLFSFSVILRILMAALIAIVIAHPIVLAMFSGNLEESIALFKQDQRHAIIQQYDMRINDLNEQINQLNTKNAEYKNVDLSDDSTAVHELKKQIDGKQQEIHNAQVDYTSEVAGDVKSHTGMAGEGPTALSIKARINSLNDELNELNTQLTQEQAKQAQNGQFKKQLMIKENQNIEKVRDANNVLIAEKLGDLDKLKQDKQQALNSFDKHLSFDFLTLTNELDKLSKNNSNVFLWKWLLTALLLVIDLFAVLLKVLSDKDDYDDKKGTGRFIEAENNKAKRTAYTKSEQERVALEYKKEVYSNKKAQFQLQYDFNIEQLNKITDYAEAHHASVQRFTKVIAQKDSDEVFVKTVINEYHAVSNAIFNNVMTKFREIAEF